MASSAANLDLDALQRSPAGGSVLGHQLFSPSLAQTLSPGAGPPAPVRSSLHHVELRRILENKLTSSTLSYKAMLRNRRKLNRSIQLQPIDQTKGLEGSKGDPNLDLI